MKIATALVKAQRRLANSSDAPHLDAERLLLHVLNRREGSWLLTHADDSLPTKEAVAYQAVIAERATGKPLAYILGTADFYGRSFSVSPAVLIPRPTTEDLVDVALATVKKLHQQLGRPLTVADIGTGTGCIAITLALETTPDEVGQMYATDISLEALDVAEQNAAAHPVANRIIFRPGSLLEPLTDITIDLLVSNPPYVPTNELAQAGQSIDTIGLTFEPSVALDGGADGQTYLDALIKSGLPLIAETTGGKIQTRNHI